MQSELLERLATPLPHPGEILLEDFMTPLGLSALALSRRMGLTDRTRIERLSRGLAAVTPDTALRLGRVFGNAPQFWLNLQAQHDLSRLWLERGAQFAQIKPISEAKEPVDHTE